VNHRLRAALIAGAVAAATFNVVTGYFNGWPTPQSSAFVVDSTLVLLAYLVVGLIAWQRRPGEQIGLLFTIVGYEWLLPALTNLHYAVPFTAGNLSANLYQAGLAHLALAWPYGRLRSRLDRAVVAGTYAWNLGNTAVGMMLWNPRTNGCTACPPNLLLVGGSSRTADIVSWTASVIGVLNTVIVVSLIAGHWSSGRGYSRAAMTRLLWVASPIAAYILALDVISGFNLNVSNLLVYQLGPLILIAAPLAYAAGMLHTRQARAAVGVALMDLEPGPPPDRLLEALARALGDRTLQLAFRTPDGAGYVDTGNQPVEIGRLPRGRMLTPLDPGGDCVLIGDEDLRHEPELMRVTAAAATMALQHSRLRAEIELQLEQVRSSRARIVEAGDAARSRLERDLHDGAQQRLVTLSLALGMARSRAAGDDPELQSLLESAADQARAALVELRELARGIHPAVLTESGLSGAIQALAERSPVPTTVVAVPAGRFPAPIEATAYFVVCEALANVAKHAPAASARVVIRQLADWIVVEVCDNGPGGARSDTGSGLRGLADRVASVGGVLQIDSPDGRGTRLEAQVPCL
jgi:signal transduction histidine kinase